MRKLLPVLVILATVSFSACKNQCPPLTDSQKADIQKQILELWDKITIPIEKVDVDGYAAFLSSDEFLGMYSGGGVFKTKTELVDTARVWFSHRKSNQLENKTVKATVLNENLVILDQLCIFQINFKDDQIWRLNHAITFIFKKEVSGWKIIHGHESWNRI